MMDDRRTTESAYTFFFFVCWGLTIAQPLWVILCRLPEKGRKELGPNIHWTSNYGTGIVFIGNMLSWLSFHNFV